MLDHQCRYPIGKLIDDKMATTLDLYKPIPPAYEVRGELRSPAADAPVCRAPDIERGYRDSRNLRGGNIVCTIPVDSCFQRSRLTQRLKMRLEIRISNALAFKHGS